MLPKDKSPAGLRVPEIIRFYNRAVPPRLMASSFMERNANWLALWTYHVMRDSRVRENALDLALNELMAWPIERLGQPQRAQ